MQGVIREIMDAMAGDLTAEQLQKLSNVLQIKLTEWRHSETQVVKSDDGWERILKMFLATKKLENCSDGTLDAYRRCIVMMMQSIGKRVQDITVNDLRYYLARYQQDRNISLSYLETLRHYISSFFGWCAEEGYLRSNPARRLIRVKVPKKNQAPIYGRGKGTTQTCCRKAAGYSTHGGDVQHSRENRRNRIVKP